MKIYPNTHKTTRKNLKKSKKYRFTIIIPTFNRPEYLRRLLGYYARDGLDINCKIVIVDSSSEKNKSTNKETIHYFSNLDVLYLDNFSENIHPYIKQLFALGQVDTEYCVVCPDDDFILIDAINQAVDFFEKNPDTKLTVPVHLMGFTADMDSINAMAKKYGCRVVKGGMPGMGGMGY